MVSVQNTNKSPCKENPARVLNTCYVAKEYYDFWNFFEIYYYDHVEHTDLVFPPVSLQLL